MPAPPPPPDVARTIRLSAGQRVLLPVLLLVVSLAMAGAFGESTVATRVTSGALDLRVRCPARLRYRQSQSLMVEVRNAGRTRLEAVRVGLDAAYLSHFAAVRVMPPEQDAATVVLGALDPGASRTLLVELAGEDYWRHTGTFAVTAGAEAARFSCSTLVFP